MENMMKQSIPIHIPTDSWDSKQPERTRLWVDEINSQSSTSRDETSESLSAPEEGEEQSEEETEEENVQMRKNTCTEDITAVPAKKLLLARAMADKLMQEKQVTGAIRELIRCVVLARITYGDGHWRLAQSHANLAYGYLQLKELPLQAKQHAESAKNIMLTRTHKPDSAKEKKEILETLLTLFYTLGAANLILNTAEDCYQNLQKAEKIMEDMQRMCKTKNEEACVSEKQLTNALGRACLLQNNPVLAREYFNKTAALVAAKEGDCTEELISIYHDMAKAEQMRGKHDKSIEHLLQAHSVAVALYTKLSVEAAQTALQLAKGYAAPGRVQYFQPAEMYFQDSINAYQTALGADSPQYFSAVDDFSIWLIQTGNKEEAFDYLKKSLKTRLEVFGDFSENVAETYYKLGSISMADGDVKKASKFLKKCVMIQNVVYGAQHKKTRQTQQFVDKLQKND
ncbi:tetratricopeptide repeat protein 23-like [Protopterus annectens]|uniref:tetratricopeptide repeat protein 23-like n=1 Tax=Protopterus annectens TaxID=7888 RepID=UPI001CFB4545|nr:tetratricopeptide repeat protein 23-like [Protopterus annectens]